MQFLKCSNALEALRSDSGLVRLFAVTTIEVGEAVKEGWFQLKG
jgi:hypothetical protein